MAKYYGMIWTYGKSLAHFGIKGQKWGIRRFQYENGSYTPEGKERYGRGSETGGPQKGLAGGLFFFNRKSAKTNVEKDFDEAIEQNQDVFNRIQENNKKLVDQANALSDSYEKFHEHVKLSKESKERIWDGLHDDFGNDGTDDEELYDLVVRDRVYDELTEHPPKDIKEEREAFDRAIDQYWKDVDTISDSVRQKYKGNKSADAEINKLIGDKLQTSFISYLSKHFDDYWVFETEAFQEACMRLEDQFPFKEYQKRMSNR